ncbi:hypothetical protein [Roseiconus lacunae]|uniref:Uncharacterized protein n=1 Tax=Roseiconus lacunae TaxID=2605694 RepID=A0ABT7PPE0_9BACT|nr:hypothetical protein [Roseiconus lacunae]MDM4018372.1 hypothetical protein [Roseiconus lacunae]WRQ49241.1 hypothetical protein U8335_20060 [Stieleria sp. HD01]
MDQVKEALAVAMKYGFWIGSAVVLLGGVSVWYLSTSTLDQEISKQISSINSDFQKVTSYSGEMPSQPNDLSHQLMEGMIEERKGEVMQAWQNVFDAQRDILTWPPVMQKEFLDEFQYARDEETGEVDESKLKLPFEQYEEFGNEEHENVNPELLRRYERYIGEVLPEIAAIAKAQWKADFNKRPTGGMGGMGGDMGYDDMMGGMGMSMGAGGPRVKVNISGSTDEPVVKWSIGSQESILKDMFPWRGTKDNPSELDVYYSQENLWILKQMLQIIANVNGDAKQAFEAKIREIKAMGIGKSVTFDEGTISDPGSRAMNMGMGMGMDMGYDDMGMGGDYDSMDPGSSMGLGSTVEATDPGDGRYVNTAFEPIDAATLRSAFLSNDPSQVAIAVAKRVPVMMKLQMEQQSIPELLAACGNAPLMVDVHQVRVMPKGASSAAGGMGGMGGDMGYDDMMGGMEMGMGMDMGMGGGGGGGMAGGINAGKDEEFATDLDVEIYGLIYFWNPPSTEALGVEKVQDQEEVTIDASAEVIDALPNPNDSPAEVTTPPAGSGTPAGTQPGQPAATPENGTTPAAPAAPAGNTPPTANPGDATPPADGGTTAPASPTNPAAAQP